MSLQAKKIAKIINVLHRTCIPELGNEWKNNGWVVPYNYNVVNIDQNIYRDETQNIDEKRCIHICYLEAKIGESLRQALEPNPWGLFKAPSHKELNREGIDG